MENNRIIRWLLIVAGLGFILFVGSHLFFHLGGWGQRGMAVWQSSSSQIMIVHRGFRQGQFGGMGMMAGAGQISRVHRIFSIGPVIVALIMAAIGWFLRKNAKGCTGKKVAGWLLMGIAALMILGRVVPFLIFIMIGIIIWRLVTKDKKEHKVDTLAEDPSFESVSPVVSNTGKMLDEWERNISKEEH